MTLPEWAANTPVGDLWVLVVFLIGVLICMAVLLTYTEICRLRTLQQLEQAQQKLQQVEASDVHGGPTSPPEGEAQ